MRRILIGCLIGIVPFLVADMLKSNSGDCPTGDDWTSIAVSNGKLVPQNPATSELAAHKLLALPENADGDRLNRCPRLA